MENSMLRGFLTKLDQVEEQVKSITDAFLNDHAVNTETARRGNPH